MPPSDIEPRNIKWDSKTNRSVPVDGGASVIDTPGMRELKIGAVADVHSYYRH